MYKTKTYVRCGACGEDHATNEVEFVNIEENLQGQDVLTYVCPQTQETTSAVVWRQ